MGFVRLPGWESIRRPVAGWGRRLERVELEVADLTVRGSNVSIRPPAPLLLKFGVGDGDIEVLVLWLGLRLFCVYDPYRICWNGVFLAPIDVT